MIAGVVLGPSVLGLLQPQFQQWLFPKELLSAGEHLRHPSMQILYALSQLGLALYMFLVGVEFDIDLLKQKGKSAALVSFSGIAAPFLLGLLVASMIHTDSRFFPARVGGGPAALYMGAAMCITAFPMLARIIREKGIAGTAMGSLALAAGAFDDVVAWTLLAIVLAVTKSNVAIGLWAVAGGLAYAFFVLTAGSKVFGLIQRNVEREGEITPTTFALCIGIVMLGSWYTDAIGIYAVFGAFICGAAVPKGALGAGLVKSIEPLAVGLLLPLFFVFSGLNTRIDLINSPSLWGIAIVILLAAIIGKGLACTLAARFSGEPWRESVAIGTLMNSRGLMELIILNIGLQQGVITPTLFTMLVLMAIVTTLMASPLFEKVYGYRLRKQLRITEPGPLIEPT